MITASVRKRGPASTDAKGPPGKADRRAAFGASETRNILFGKGGDPAGMPVRRAEQGWSATGILDFALIRALASRP